MLVQGQIIAINPPNYQDQWGNQYQNIVVRTISGDVTGRIATKKPYTAQNLNQNGQFDCEEAQNNQGTYYKFKKHYDTPYQQRGQSTPQNPQQAPSRPAQGTNYQQPAPQGKKEPNWDAIARGKVRNSVVCAFIGAPIDAMPSIKDMEYWVDYIMTGIDPNQSKQNNSVEAQFCDECRNLKEECTCKPSY
ncbi:MAG: hypothetical protein KAS32_07600 [Candidatus Peribacteraceae bacterium]|nr:hypothetical protein [Candidatus Peribacteraceae bacterium]